MSKERDLFDKVGPDMAFALMNLQALRVCVSDSGTPIVGLINDVRERLRQYADCSEEDVMDACERIFGKKI